MSRPREALAALLLVGTAFACEPRPKSQLAIGAGVFQRACASCHAVPAGRKAALGFQAAPPDLFDAKLLEHLSDAEIRTVIREGKGQMPPFGRMLSEAEVSAVLAYLRDRARSTPPAR